MINSTMINHKYFKILLLLLIMIGLLYTPIYRTQQVQAGFFGILGNCLKTVVISALIGLFQSVVIAFLFTVPTFDAATVSQWIKEYIKDPLARCMARGVFDEVVGGMLDVIRKKGRDGGASYIRNWRNFQTQAQYRGEDIFRGVIANAPICNYLRAGIRDAYGVTSQSNISLSGINLRVNALHPFALQSQCPLGDNFNLSAYTRDPAANGGWDTFNRMLLPSGNQIGLSLMAQAELSKERGIEESSDLNEAGASEGALGLRGSETAGTGGAGSGSFCKSDSACLTTETCANKTCRGGTLNGAVCSIDTDCSGGVCGGACTAIDPKAAEPSCLRKGPNGQCTQYADIRTPGSYIKEVLAQQVQQEMAWITNVDELRELVINYIFTRLANRLKDIGADEELPAYTNAESGFSPDGTTVTGGTGGISPAPVPTTTTGSVCWGIATCTETNGSFQGDIDPAITAAVASNPSLFSDAGYPSVCRQGWLHVVAGQELAYLDAVAAQLNSRGYNSFRDNKDAVFLSKNNTSEVYDVLASNDGGNCPWRGNQPTCVCSPALTSAP